MRIVRDTYGSYFDSEWLGDSRRKSRIAISLRSVEEMAGNHSIGDCTGCIRQASYFDNKWLGNGRRRSEITNFLQIGSKNASTWQP